MDCLVRQIPRHPVNRALAQVFSVRSPSSNLQRSRAEDCSVSKAQEAVFSAQSLPLEASLVRHNSHRQAAVSLASPRSNNNNSSSSSSSKGACSVRPPSPHRRAGSLARRVNLRRRAVSSVLQLNLSSRAAYLAQRLSLNSRMDSLALQLSPSRGDCSGPHHSNNLSRYVACSFITTSLTSSRTLLASLQINYRKALR